MEALAAFVVLCFGLCFVFACIASQNGKDDWSLFFTGGAIAFLVVGTGFYIVPLDQWPTKKSEDAYKHYQKLLAKEEYEASVKYIEKKEEETQKL